MKIRILAAAVLAAFIMSVTLNIYAQSDTKKVEKKVQTTEKKGPKTDKKMMMKKGEKTDKVTKTTKVKKTEGKMDKKGSNKTKVIKKDETSDK